MRAFGVLFSCILLSQQALGYFSEGWKPGQAVKTVSLGSGFNPQPTAAAVQKGTDENNKKSSAFDLSTYLEKEPIRGILERFGVNITDRLATARASALQSIWNEDVPLITDSNYKEMIVEEQMSEEEEAKRVWLLVITISSAQNEGVSRFVDTQFDAAFNMTQEAGDLSHVRWGRIDYMNVTAITTKWGIWRAPYLVVLRDRGKDLRFYKAHQIRLNPEVLREFLKNDAWLRTPSWSTAYAPGGSREFILDYLSIVLMKVYDIMVLLPRWLMVILSGGIASVSVNLLHGGFWPFGKKKAENVEKKDGKAEKEVAQVKGASAPEKGTAVVSSAKSNSSSGAKQRRSGKK